MLHNEISLITHLQSNLMLKKYHSDSLIVDLNVVFYFCFDESFVLTIDRHKV